MPIGSASDCAVCNSNGPYPVVLTTTRDVPAGDSIIVTGYDLGPEQEPNGGSCTDSAGNTYHTDVSLDDHAESLLVVCSAPAIPRTLPAGSTITLTLGQGASPQWPVMQAFDVPGLVVAPLDQTSAQVFGGALPSSGSTGTTTQPDELLFGVFGDPNAPAAKAGFANGTNGTLNDCASTATPIYTGLAGTDFGGGQPSLFDEYCQVSAQGAYSANAIFQVGSANAAIVTYKIGIAPNAPVITNIPNDATFGGSFTPDVSTDSDGVTSVASSTPSVCTVQGTTVAFVGLGACTLTASVAASSTYAAATGSAQSFTVGPAPTTLVANTSTVRHHVLQWSLTMSATLNSGTTGAGVSGQPVTFTAGRESCTATTDASGVASCSVSGFLIFTGRGTYTATFAGSGDYLPSSATGRVREGGLFGL